MFDSYEDACEATLTRKEALKEIALHHADVADFLMEVGSKDEYTGQEVLDWLGY